MIRITRQTDYGILILSQLASEPTQAIHAAKDVAKRSGIPLPMASKILKALARAGLLASHRGVKGGYSLAGPASGISTPAVLGTARATAFRKLRGRQCSSSPKVRNKKL